MHAGKAYKLSEFLIWTRRNIYKILLISIVPVILYEFLDLSFIAIPFTVVALLGTATAFIVGFKNTQTYNRTWEARQIWGAVINSSRTWGIMTRDFIENPAATKDLFYRHFAWLTALRYALRESKEWETTNKAYNKEYKDFYIVPERETTLENELKKYISADEVAYIMSVKNKQTQLLSLQSKAVKKLLNNKEIDTHQFVALEQMVKDLYDQQGKSERIKNFPYPRQFSTISSLFVKLFCILLPFGLLREFDKLNDGITGIFAGNMVWLVIPFSVIVGWVFTSLEQVGESTENPFEGSANDVPISQISRAIEIDMREMLGEIDLPEGLQAKNNIIL